jgi:hypothetical protein
MRKSIFTFLLLVSFLSCNAQQDFSKNLAFKGYRLSNDSINAQLYYVSSNDTSDIILHQRAPILTKEVFFKFLGGKLVYRGVTYVKIIVPGERSLVDNVDPTSEMRINKYNYNTPFWVNELDLRGIYKEYYNTFRFVSSVLSLPFKARIGTKYSKSNFEGSFNVGPAVGFNVNMDKKGISFYDFMISGGITSITMNSSNNKSITDDKTSTVLGLIVTVLPIAFSVKNTTFGLAFGWDFAFGDDSKDEGWIYNPVGKKYNGIPWLSFAFGYNFFTSKSSDSDSRTNSGTVK